MILLLRDQSGAEFRLGVAHGRFDVPDSDIVHDLRHLVALGGLADCHAHLSGDDVADMIEYDGAAIEEKMLHNARLQMEGGVLLLAEKGSKSSISLRILSEEESQRPRMQMAGRMIAVDGGYYPGFAAEIDEANLENVIAEAVGDGATWIKLVGDWPRRGVGAIPNFSEGALRQIVALAHGAGCKVAIHTAAPETPGMAVRAGVDSIEHGLYLTLADVAELGERGGAWVPTVVAMEAISQWLGSASSGGRVIAAGLENTAELLPLAVEAGVAVLAGTDLALQHGTVATEAIRLTEYGLSRKQALHSVTRAAYDYLGLEAGFSPGLPADAVFFASDPVKDLSALLEPKLVIRAGRIVLGQLDR
ncbi:MAG: amidohydrolase family protein [Actinomycetota bacterium]|nr:amidohydrolase family protein [Actinomycetota bacterium]